MLRNLNGNGIRKKLTTGILSGAWLVYIPVPLISLTGCIHEQNEQMMASVNTQSAESIYRVGVTMQKSGDYVTAMNMYKQALSLDGTYTPALINLAQVARLQRQTNDTILLLEQANVREPDSVPLKIELAKLYITTNRSSLAESILVNVLRREESLDIMNALGVALDMQEKHQQAQHYYLKILATDPHHQGVMSNMGLSLALAGRYQESLKYFENLLKRDHPSRRDRHNAALVYILTGQCDKAEKIYKLELGQAHIDNNIKWLSMLKSQLVQTIDKVNDKPKFNGVVDTNYSEHGLTSDKK